MRRKILAGILFTLAAVLLFFIYCFSEQDSTASSSLSEEVTRFLMRLMNPSFMGRASAGSAKTVLSFLKLPVRKLAHFSEYALLGALLIGGFLCLRFSMGLRLFFPFLICGVCACADEYHQTFVSGRAGQWSDILIDISGAAAGILFVFVLSLAVLYLMGASRLKKASRAGRKKRGRSATYRSAPSPSGKRPEF